MAIKFQYNKTSLQQLEKQLKVRVRTLPIIKNKESAFRKCKLGKLIFNLQIFTSYKNDNGMQRLRYKLAHPAPFSSANQF